MERVDDVGLAAHALLALVQLGRPGSRGGDPRPVRFAVRLEKAGEVDGSRLHPGHLASITRSRPARSRDRSTSVKPRSERNRSRSAIWPGSASRSKAAPAAEAGGRLLDEPAREVESVGSAGERKLRLGPARRLHRPHLLVAEVGRVGGDEVVGPVHPGEQVRMEEAELAPEQGAAVGREHRRGGGGDVGGADVQVGPLAAQRDRHAAAAGAGVVHARSGSRQGDGALDQELGVRPRDQHRGADREAQAVELLAAADVGDGDSAFAPDEQLPVAAESVALHRVGKPREHLLARRAERLGQQQRSVELRSLDPAIGEPEVSFSEGLADGHALRSCSRALSLSASITSARSPSMMESRW